MSSTIFGLRTQNKPLAFPILEEFTGRLDTQIIAVIAGLVTFALNLHFELKVKTNQRILKKVKQ